MISPMLILTIQWLLPAGSRGYEWLWTAPMVRQAHSFRSCSTGSRVPLSQFMNPLTAASPTTGPIRCRQRARTFCDGLRLDFPDCWFVVRELNDWLRISPVGQLKLSAKTVGDSGRSCRKEVPSTGSTAAENRKPPSLDRERRKRLPAAMCALRSDPGCLERDTSHRSACEAPTC